MRFHLNCALLVAVIATATASFALADEPPVIPIGEDAYLMWDRLPYHRIGVRAQMNCTYDRQGGNRSADASHFLYQQADDFNVSLDVTGPGVLYFKRTNHFHGSPWHYEVDGEDMVVKETATDNPVGAKKRLKDSTFIPEELFPHPLVWTWPTTKGADLMWRPIPFEDSLRLAYSRTFYGTGYYILHKIARGTENLSRPLETWDRQPPEPGVLELLRSAGSDIAPKGEGVAKSDGTLTLRPNEWQALKCPVEAPATIRAIKFTVPRDRAYEFGKCRLRITWDDRWHPSVDAPIDLFFGAGHLHNDNDREYLVRGLPMVIRYTEDTVELACYYPMPFFKNARIEIENRGDKPLADVQYEIRTVPYDDPQNHVGYFHATYTDHSHPPTGLDNVFLDTNQVEGGGPWSGNFVGMSWIFSEVGNLRTLEGDPRLYFDNSRTPQGHATGTEEWGGGGDYWGGLNMTIPLAGHPVGTAADKKKTDRDLVNSAYRFLIADLFPFGNRAVVCLERGGDNRSQDHYSGVAYWYGSPSATLVETDEINVCHEKDAEAHHYNSPTAKKPYELVSRYDGGADKSSGGARLNFPAERDSVRTMSGTSEFDLKLDPDNLGVMLRRKFDYQYPNQRAKVSVRPAGSDGEWKYVGDWYDAGSNTCVYSRPDGHNFTEAELSPTEHHVITSNRRWRESEFLIPRSLTDGVEKLSVRIEFVPNDRPLFPGHPFPVKNAWSESRYWAFCYRLPESPVSNKD